MLRHQIDLDVVPGGDLKEIWLNQYDEDFELQFDLFSRDGDFVVQSGTTAAIRGTKPDGNGFSADAVLSGTQVIVAGDSQITAVAGRAIFELTLYKDEKKLNSANFFINVRRAALDKDTVISQSQTRELVEIEDNADEIIAAADRVEAALAVFDNAVSVISDFAENAYGDNAIAFGKGSANANDPYTVKMLKRVTEPPAVGTRCFSVARGTSYTVTELESSSFQWFGFYQPSGNDYIRVTPLTSPPMGTVLYHLQLTEVDRTEVSAATPAYAEVGYETGKTIAEIVNGGVEKLTDYYDAAFIKFGAAVGDLSKNAGQNSLALGDGSSAEGKGTVAAVQDQHVFGRYNAADNDALVLVGNGTDNEHRSNAAAIKEDGSAYFSGDVYSDNDKLVANTVLNTFIEALAEREATYVKKGVSTYTGALLASITDNQSIQYCYASNSSDLPPGETRGFVMTLRATNAGYTRIQVFVSQYTGKVFYRLNLNGNGYPTEGADENLKYIWTCINITEAEFVDKTQNMTAFVNALIGTKTNLSFETGTLGTSNGQPSSSSNRLRSAGYIPFSPTMVLLNNTIGSATVLDGYICLYDAAGNYIATSPAPKWADLYKRRKYLSDYAKYDNVANFKVVLRKTDNGSFDANTLSYAADNIHLIDTSTGYFADLFKNPEVDSIDVKHEITVNDTPITERIGNLWDLGDVENAERGIAKIVNLIPGETYTLSGDFSSDYAGGNAKVGRCRVSLIYGDESKSLNYGVVVTEIIGEDDDGEPITKSTTVRELVKAGTISYHSSGSYTFTVPEDAVAGNYRLRILACNTYDHSAGYHLSATNIRLGRGTVATQEESSSDTAIDVVAREKAEGLSVLYHDADMTFDADLVLNVAVKPDMRNILISTRAAFSYGEGFAFIPRNARLYQSYATNEVIAILNSSKRAEYSDGRVYKEPPYITVEETIEETVEDTVVESVVEKKYYVSDGSVKYNGVTIPVEGDSVTIDGTSYPVTYNDTAPYSYLFNSSKSADYTDVDPTTYYLATGKEINRRLAVCERIGGNPIGWIDACHVPQPKIYPYYRANGTTVMYGAKYVVGRNGDRPIDQQFRMPSPSAAVDVLRLSFQVPDGCTLVVSQIDVRYSDEVNRDHGGLEIDTHGAVMQYPEHSRLTLETAAKCGAKRFIVIPKRSSDGVLFAYHDDTFDMPKTILRNTDGTKITNKEDFDETRSYASQYPDTDIRHYNWYRFYSIPFDVLEKYDWGIYKGTAYAGTKPLLIADMFSVCAKTGMHPMFSLHPYEPGRLYDVYLPEAQAIKDLAQQYNVRDWLTLKNARINHFTGALFQTFGNSVEKYATTIEQTPKTMGLVGIDYTLAKNGVDGLAVFIPLFAQIIKRLRGLADAPDVSDIIKGYKIVDTDGGTPTVNLYATRTGSGTSASPLAYTDPISITEGKYFLNLSNYSVWLMTDGSLEWVCDPVDIGLQDAIDIYSSACDPDTIDTTSAPPVNYRFYRDTNTGKIHYYSGVWIKTGSGDAPKAEFPLLDRNKVMIELFATKVTPARIKRILDAGFKAGVATLAHIGADGKWRSYLDSDDYDYYTLLGCSEFTDNKNMSLGLNW